MSPEQIDRSVLAGKDRDELHTIASAIGVKAATRMRKADLVEAIMGVVEGGNGNGEQSETAGKGPGEGPAGLVPCGQGRQRFRPRVQP